MNAGDVKGSTICVMVCKVKSYICMLVMWGEELYMYAGDVRWRVIYVCWGCEVKLYMYAGDARWRVIYVCWGCEVKSYICMLGMWGEELYMYAGDVRWRVIYVCCDMRWRVIYVCWGCEVKLYMYAGDVRWRIIYVCWWCEVKSYICMLGMQQSRITDIHRTMCHM